MRSFFRRVIISGLSLSTLAAWAGCSPKQATEYVAGISTQVSVPRDLKALRVDVTVGGFPFSCRGYRVYDGRVQLPRSLGAFAQTENAITTGPVTYTITGLTEEFAEDSSNPLFSGIDGVCLQPKVGSNSVRVLRRSRQPYVPDEILFLPMPLKYSCYDKSCPDDQTCKGGKCVPLENPSVEQAKAKYPKYEPELVDGTGSGCFSTALCMGAKLPAVPVPLVDGQGNKTGADPCTYAIAGGSNALPPLLPGATDIFAGKNIPAGGGMNVEVVYDGGLNSEILDLDIDEGFQAVPNKPGHFKLAEGLCEMVRGLDKNDVPLPPAPSGEVRHRITGVFGSTTCSPKTITQPICADDAFKQMKLNPDGTAADQPLSCKTVELKPPESALILVIDNTDDHQAFFSGFGKAPALGPDGKPDEDTYVEPAVRNALSDPAFQRTDVGVVFSPGANACNVQAGGPLDIAAGRALEKRDPIINDLKGRRPGTGLVAQNDVQFEGALGRAYAALKDPKYDNYFRKAVLVFGNRQFDANQCGGPEVTPITLADNAFKADKIETYVMQIAKTRNGNTVLETKDPSGDALAAVGVAPQTPPAFSSFRATEATSKFTEIINRLGTCVYDVDDNADAPRANDLISFSSPLTGEQFVIRYNQNGCTTENAAGEGWNFAPAGVAPAGKKRIYLCAGTKEVADGAGVVTTPATSCEAYRLTLQRTSAFTALYQQPALPVPIFAYKAACQ